MRPRVIYQDIVGQAERPTGLSISQLKISDPLKHALIDFFRSDIHLSPPQVWAVEKEIFFEKAHFLVSAPTNSGKTLIALLRIFSQAIDKGHRSVYVVPLKALAEEKADEIRRLADCIVQNGGPEIRVHVSTGDYQLSGDFLGSPPPDVGDIVICTPERLDVILCNPDNLEWAKSVSTYVLDEFHLLGEKRRGATMESLVTRLLLHVNESSLIALSATIGGLEKIEGWLSHTGHNVHTLKSEYRFPTLERIVIETDDKDAFIVTKAKQILEKEDQSLLVFVYRKSDAVKLANTLIEETLNSNAISYFHAGLSLGERQTTARNFRDGKIRILVATTSLKMGINTPTTEVIVRDTLFYGAGQLSTADILQMLGRAGRGNAPGKGYVLCKSTETDCSYPNDFQTGNVEVLHPQLLPYTDNKWSHSKDKNSQQIDPLNSVVLSEIARKGQANVEELQEFISHTYSGWSFDLINPDLSQQLILLEHGKLIYPIENSESTYGITKLGRTTVYSGLSPESGSTLAGFLRALINLSQKQLEKGKNNNYLRRLRDLDFIFLAVSTFEIREMLLRKPSKKDRIKIEEYLEGLDVEEKPLVNIWRSTDSQDFPTRRLLSSLRFSGDLKDSDAESLFYRLMGTSILLHRYARGEKLETLTREYGIHAGMLENNLKFTVTWVLSCLAQICSPSKCYKLEYLSMQIYELLENVGLGSNLGKLLTIKGIGKKTIYKLLDAGWDDFELLKKLNNEKIINAGISELRAKKILRYANRRTR